MQVLGQGLEDALEPQNDADILKVWQCLVWSNTHFQIYDQNSWQMTSSKRLRRHHFDLSNFWSGTKTLTLIHNLSHQYRICHFSKT